jgi:hypothetical protein
LPEVSLYDLSKDWDESKSKKKKKIMREKSDKIFHQLLTYAYSPNNLAIRLFEENKE